MRNLIVQGSLPCSPEETGWNNWMTRLWNIKVMNGKTKCDYKGFKVDFTAPCLVASAWLDTRKKQYRAILQKRPPPDEKGKSCHLCSFLPRSLISSHSYQCPLGRQPGLPFTSTDLWNSTSVDPPRTRRVGCFNVALALNVIYSFIQESHLSLKVAGDSFKQRNKSESRIAQNLCSLTANLLERCASPSHRMRVWMLLHGSGTKLA